MCLLIERCWMEEKKKFVISAAYVFYLLGKKEKINYENRKNRNVCESVSITPCSSSHQSLPLKHFSFIEIICADETYFQQAFLFFIMH